MKKPPKEVDVRAHRWFDRANGNTYFAARMRDHETGDTLAHIDYAYGYGNQYEYEILDKAIETNGWESREHYAASGGSQPPWQWYKDRGIRVNYFCTDGLKRDLKNV